MKRNEICPADIIVIDISDEICLIETLNNDGSTLRSQKYPLKQTSCKIFFLALAFIFFFLFNYKLIFLLIFCFSKVGNNLELKSCLENYRKILSGKVVIENWQSGDSDQIKGYIKLKKDPKMEYFDQSNFIFSYSFLKYTDWVLGLVCFSGRECFISQSKKQILMKDNHFFDILIQRFIIIFIFIMNFLSMVNFVFLIISFKLVRNIFSSIYPQPK